jgi:hypothetical protein
LWDGIHNNDIDNELAAARAKKIPVDTFENKLMRYHNDQCSETTFEKEQYKRFEPLETTGPKEDLVVLRGMNRITDLVAGKSSRPFTYYGFGAGGRVFKEGIQV